MTASAILLMNNRRIIRFLYLSAITATLAVFPFFASAQTFSISDNATGGDCLSVGVWNNSTKTCLLTADVDGGFLIESDNITLDGNGRSIIGSEFGSVVSLRWRTGVTVKNLRISSSFIGIDIEDSDRNIISGNVISGNSDTGIYMSEGSAGVEGVLTVFLQIDLGFGVTINDIDPATIMLADAHPIKTFIETGLSKIKEKNKKQKTGNHKKKNEYKSDNNTPTLIAKFNIRDLANISTDGEVPLLFTAQLFDGTKIEGKHILRVILNHKHYRHDK